MVVSPVVRKGHDRNDRAAATRDKGELSATTANQKTQSRWRQLPGEGCSYGWQIVVHGSMVTGACGMSSALAWYYGTVYNRYATMNNPCSSALKPVQQRRILLSIGLSI